MEYEGKLLYIALWEEQVRLREWSQVELGLAVHKLLQLLLNYFCCPSWTHTGPAQGVGVVYVASSHQRQPIKFLLLTTQITRVI